MKNGFWKSIGKVPVLVLAVAVGPVALADGPALESIPADGTAAPMASAIPSTDPTASVSSPIRLISTDSILADPNCAPPAGPAAQICAGGRAVQHLVTLLPVQRLRRRLHVPMGTG